MDKPLTISEIDKGILKILLTPEGARSSASIAKKMGVAPGLVQRRRKRLEENNILHTTYSMDLNTFGWHRADLFLSTHNGKVKEVIDKLYGDDNVIRISKSIGEVTIDLRIETVIRDNNELLDTLERVKSIEGVSNVQWSEIVRTMFVKSSVPDRIVNGL
jgi:DNA-binding Lrp family transcriptional regulator